MRHAAGILSGLVGRLAEVMRDAGQNIPPAMAAE